MKVEILNQTEKDGSIYLELKVSDEDIVEAMEESKQSLAFEHGISIDALNETVGAGEILKYGKEYALSKAVNLAAEQIDVMISAPSQIYYEQETNEDGYHTFSCDIYPHPDVWLTSYDPIDIHDKRIPAPGVSMEAAKSGADVEYVKDDTVLMIELPKRLRGDISKEYIARLVQDYSSKFEQELMMQGSSIDQYCEKMGMDQKEFSSLITMEVQKKLPIDLALDALFEGLSMEITEEDICDTLAKLHPGEEEVIRKSYEDHGDMYIIKERIRRQKAFDWVRKTAIV